VDHIREITQFIVDEFLPDVDAAELAPDYDLVGGGVLDSLGLLRVIAWLEDRFGLAADDIELAPENFQTVRDINALVAAGSPVESR